MADAEIIQFPSRDEDHEERLSKQPPFKDEDKWDYNDIVESRYDLHGGRDYGYEELWLNYVRNQLGGTQEEVA